jgi:apoptosis-inducing factor 3
MSAEQSKPKGIDLVNGVAPDAVVDGGMISGHVGDDAVLLARHGDEFFAIGATCSHYGGPLAEGLMVGDTVRCPWHHARFSLRTGDAIGAPAFNPMSCWRIERRDGKVFVREKRAPSKVRGAAGKAERIVIIGGGGAGFAAAEMLRREGFLGDVTVFSSDDAAPYDRPNCSKDYLAGNAPEDWMPLRPPDFYKDQSISLELRSHVMGIDVKARHVTLHDGRSARSTSCSLRPVPNRFALRSPARTSRMCMSCDRSPTPARSLPRQDRRNVLSYSEQASSDWRLRRHCGHGA